MNKNIIILTAVAIFLVSLSRVAPVIYKNYPPSAVYENLILARNMAEGVVFKMESAKNVILSSSRIKVEGKSFPADNHLTVILYSWLYKLLGFNTNLPIYASIILFAFFNVILFLTVLKLFDYWPAVIFSSLGIFMPVIWLSAVMPGFYEFAMFFFSIALLIYFQCDANMRIHANDTNTRNYLMLLATGMFLGLAVLSRNAFLISALPLFAYDFYKTKSWKRLLILGLPFLIVIGGFFSNSFLSREADSFLSYGHLFPDPYSYHLDRDNALNEAKNIKDPDISEYLAKYGYGMDAPRFLIMYWNSISFYPKKLFSTNIFGGPIFILFLILGAVYLYKNKNDLFKYFFWFWLPFWYIALVLTKTNNWDHFLEISFPVILLITLGVWQIIELKVIRLWPAVLVLFIVLQILSADKWMFHEAYESGRITEQHELIVKAQNMPLTDSDIIAVDFSRGAPLMLNYYTDKNFIYFAPETILKLTNQNKIEEVFQYFSVTKFLK